MTRKVCVHVFSNASEIFRHSGHHTLMLTNMIFEHNIKMSSLHFILPQEFLQGGIKYYAILVRMG